MTGTGQGAAALYSAGLCNIQPPVWGSGNRCCTVRAHGCWDLLLVGVSELLGRPVQQMSHILGYLSLLEREKEKTGSFCRAPTPKLLRYYFCVASFYPGGCK